MFFNSPDHSDSGWQAKAIINFSIQRYEIFELRYMDENKNKKYLGREKEKKFAL